MTVTTRRRQALTVLDERLRAVVSPALAWWLTLGGAVLAVISTFLRWTWTEEFPGNLTINGYPGGNQIYTLALALLLLLALLAERGVPGPRALAPAGAARAVRALAAGTFAVTAYTVVAIAVNLGGLVNLEPGAILAFVAALLVLVCARAIPDDTREPAAPRRLPAAVEILIIAAVLFAGMLLFVYGLETDSEEGFIGYLLAVGFAAAALTRTGLLGRLSLLTARYRGVTALAALFAAFAFPFTQTTDAYTNIAVNILIFATVALGLNIVVGLAGLLDLGYVAFLGVGAYVGAMLSGSPFSPFKEIVLPFPAAVLCGAAAAAVAGVIIGAPTLRLRGDYLAIVTLGFGEIFRITANNLDGSNGPQVTNGPNGIPAVPDLNMFGYDFGQSREVPFLGIEFGRFSNYYLLLLGAMAIVVLIFSRANNSRIGRAWVAIREDETAAGAMGINTFRLKLLAFALGASLAGLAGTVQARVTSTVTPDQYMFLDSAFLLAAVVLGGMGTIPGPLLGATLLLLVPEKLRFFQDARLFLFGVALVLIMRIRPEGLIPSSRRRMEFHEDEVAARDAMSVGHTSAAKEGSTP